jgi:hypothetical protein
MRPEVGMRVRLKQESNRDNNSTVTIPIGSEGVISQCTTFYGGHVNVTFDNEEFNKGSGPDHSYFIKESWLEYKRGSI